MDDAELEDPKPSGASIALVAVLVVLVAGFIFVAGRNRKREPVDLPLSADMPLAIADTLIMPSGPCEVDVLGVGPDGSVLGVACGASDPAPIARDSLRVASFASARDPLPGDVVLLRTHAGFIRSIVIAPEVGARVRVRPLGTPTAAEQTVIRSDVVRVQNAAQLKSFVLVPVSDDMPLANGDLVWDRKSGASFRVDDPASADFQGQRSTLGVQGVRVRDTLPSGCVVLLRDAGKWLRRKVENDDHASLHVVPDTGGPEELRAKKDVLLVRTQK